MNVHVVIATVAFAVAGCAQDGGTAATTRSPPVASKSHPQAPSYGQQIGAAIVPHVALAEPIEGNPVVQVRVVTRPDGDVVDAQVIESSGNPDWDRSVRRAVLKAGRIPPNVDGTVPPVLIISFRPKQ